MNIKHIVISLIVLHGCHEKEQYEINQIDKSSDYSIELLELEDIHISIEEELTLNRVRDVVITNHDESLLGFINDETNEVFVLDTDGEFIGKVGQDGTGPDELSRVSSFGFDDQNNILIYDGRQDFFKKFSLNGDLRSIQDGILEDGLWIRSQKLFIVNDHAYLGIEEAADYGGGFWNYSTMAKYDIDGRLVNTFGDYDPTLIGTGPIYKYANILVDGNTVFTTHRTSPYVQVYELEDTNRAGHFGMQSENFLITDNEVEITDSREIRNEKNLHQSFVGENFTTEELYFFYFFNNSEEFWNTHDPNKRSHFLAVYKKTQPYEYLGELKLPHAPLMITSDNIIFLLKDDDPDNFIVSKYEINL